MHAIQINKYQRKKPRYIELEWFHTLVHLLLGAAGRWDATLGNWKLLVRKKDSNSSRLVVSKKWNSFHFLFCTKARGCFLGVGGQLCMVGIWWSWEFGVRQLSWSSNSSRSSCCEASSCLSSNTFGMLCSEIWLILDMMRWWWRWKLSQIVWAS